MPTFVTANSAYTAHSELFDYVRESDSVYQSFRSKSCLKENTNLGAMVAVLLEGNKVSNIFTVGTSFF